MASLGKKILSAFVEVTDDEKSVTHETVIPQHVATVTPAKIVSANSLEKFRKYFDKLFSEANLPGPDYFEFAKMTQAMLAIADEKARYTAAFAGLSVQGLDKNKLLSTAAEYVQLLQTDAANFNSTVDTALIEKVQVKQQDIVTKKQRMEQLAKEIDDLQKQIQLLQMEVQENEEKIESNTGAYKTASENMKQQILQDIERIKQHIV